MATPKLKSDIPVITVRALIWIHVGLVIFMAFTYWLLTLVKD
ncbi:hypothetical protein [Ameyamaea chiangmaiensis]|nr:hypothetical protein [Ameyamaea chiangmaiensis]